METLASAVKVDRRTGAVSEAAWHERAGVEMLRLAGKHWYDRLPGFSWVCRLVGLLVPTRKPIVVEFDERTRFAFPFADGYWSALCYGAHFYEPEIEAFLARSREIDFAFVDCGANFGYWSVRVTSPTFGENVAVAIEPSSDTLEHLRRNAALNGNRFRVMRNAVSGRSGETVNLYGGSKHEQRSIVSEEVRGGVLETVTTLKLDDLADDLPPGVPVVLKLDVEGMEVEALTGAQGLMDRDGLLIYEDHGHDRTHAVTRAVLKMGYSVFWWDEGPFRPIGDVGELDRIKTDHRAGYDFFATRSPLWLGLLGGARGAAQTTVQE